MAGTGGRWKARASRGLVVGTLAVTVAVGAGEPRFARAGEPPSLLDRSPQEALGVPSYLQLVIKQTSELWVNPFGGARQTAVYTGLLEVGAELSLGEAGWLSGASLGAVGFLIQGRDISEEGVGDAGVVSNIAGFEAVRFFSAWFEQRWADDTVSLKLGMIPLDDDFLIVDSALLFVNSGFGLVQTLALSVPTPVYPLAAFGLRLLVRVSDEWTIQAGAYDGDAGAEPVDRPVSDIELSLDQAATVVLETAWAPASGEGRVGIGGVYHLGIVENQFTAEEDRGIAMFYLMLERRLGRDGVAFAHASVALPGELVTSVLYADLGAVVEGRAWHRPNDRLGFGVTWTRFSLPYVDAQRAAGQIVTTAEWVAELTYELSLVPWIRIQPSIQWIGHAHFTAADALAVGLRGSISL